MRDFYKEQLVKKIPDETDSKRKFRILLIAIAFCVFFSNWVLLRPITEGTVAFGDMGLVLIVTGIVIFVAYKKIKGLNVEYEYTYSESYLEIDIIRNKAKRKRVFEGDVTEFEIVAHIDDEEHLGMYRQLPVQSFASGEKLGNTYVFVTNYKGKRKKFIFEPNEEMLQALAVDLTPRRMIRKK